MRKIYLSALAALMSLASFAQVTFTCTEGTNFGQNEGMDKLFDGNVNTKYCGNVGSYALVTASEAVYVWGYEMTTANDNEQYGRCVTRWTLKGTNDEAVAADANSDQWVTLSGFGANGFVQRKNFYTQRFFCDAGAEQTAYKYFKVELNEGGFVQLSEFALCCQTTPVVTYNYLEGSNENAQKAFDLKLGQKWEGNNLSGNWFTVETADGKPHTVKSYSFSTHDDGSWPDRAPKHWTLEGSNDNATWTLLDEVDDNPIQNENYKTFDFTPAEVDKAFRYLKVSLVEMKGTGWTQVGEFHVVGACENHDWVVVGGKEATCSEDGGLEYECSVCGSHKLGDVIPATGEHNFADRYCTMCGTPDPEAVEQDECGTYQLSTVEDLKWLGAMAQAGYVMHVQLANDIDLEGTDFQGICIGDNVKPLEGEFNGNNHFIKNLNINSDKKNTAFIGNAQYLHIHNVAFTNANVVANKPNTGVVIGDGNSVSIAWTAVLDSYVEGYDHVGALAGNTKNSSNVLDCYSDADVHSTQYQAGGLVGTSNGLFIDHCVFAGAVSNDHFNASGLIALIDSEDFPTHATNNLIAAESIVVGNDNGTFPIVNTAGRYAEFENNYIVATTTFTGNGYSETRVFDDINGSDGKTIDVATAQSAEFAFETLRLDNETWAVVENLYPQLFWVYDALHPGVITAINAVENNVQNAGIFNIAGQRMAQPQKGINIINGKKVVIK